jgi:hypothetical protein
MSFFQKIKHGAAKAADKAQRTVETTKLSAQISRKRKEMKDNFTEIGSAVYQAYRSGDLSLAEQEIARLSHENAAIEAAIADIHMKISQLHDERLCLCGHATGADAIYCPACGRKLETELPAAAAATDVTEAPEFVDDNAEIRTEEETPVYEGIEEVRCRHCRQELHHEDHICPRCGTVQALPGQEQR